MVDNDERSEPTPAIIDAFKRTIVEASREPSALDIARNMAESPDNWPPMRVKQVAEALLATVAGSWAGVSRAGEEDGAFTPTGAAKILVTIYGHANWKPTGLEAMALLVARTFLAQRPDPRETIPHYGHGPQETARNNG